MDNGIQGHIKYSQEYERMSKSGSSSNSNSPLSVPHMTHEKIRMIDITRDKPIKVTVRVSVPVRDHPKFNFVGKLLGPKGNSLRRLQEETMCKMAVLGRGSMRDRKKEEELRLSGEHKYSHLTDDLHVEISAFAPAAEAHARIAYALAEVRRFLVPDHHDDIRQEQKWEIEALTSQLMQNDSLEDNSIEIAGNENRIENISLDCSDNGSVISDESPKNTINHVNNNNIIINNNNNCDTTNNVEKIDDTPTLTFIEKQSPVLHPALRGVNITAGSIGRKRPLLCSSRNTPMNPTKRTVMTFLTRAKTANTLHGFHATGPSITDSLQLLASPLIIPPMEHHMIPSATTIPLTTQVNAQVLKKENLLQGA